MVAGLGGGRAAGYVSLLLAWGGGQLEVACSKLSTRVDHGRGKILCIP